MQIQIIIVLFYMQNTELARLGERHLSLFAFDEYIMIMMVLKYICFQQKTLPVPYETWGLSIVLLGGDKLRQPPFTKQMPY